MLLACIRNLGDYPSIHDLTLKSQIDQLGTKMDRHRREVKARKDTEQRQGTIEKVRTWIFDLGYSVGSKALDLLLKPFSWTPTRVGLHFISGFIT